MSPHHVRQRYARVAGFAFLFYIAAGLTETAIFSGAVVGGSASEKLTNVLAHEAHLRLTVVLSLATVLSALALAVSLYVVTRDYDKGLALFGLTARTAEGVIGAIYALPALGLLSAARAFEGQPHGPEADVFIALLLDARQNTMMLSAICFAAGSTIFSWLLLRGHAVPIVLGRLGVFASVLLLLALPAQLAVNSQGILSMLVWLPMLLFEVILAWWLIVRGVRPLNNGGADTEVERRR